MIAIHGTEAKRAVKRDFEKKAVHSAEGAAFLDKPATRSHNVVSEKVSWSPSLTALLYLNPLHSPAVEWVKWRRRMEMVMKCNTPFGLSSMPLESRA